MILEGRAHLDWGQLNKIGSTYSFGTIGSPHLYLVVATINDRPTDVGDDVDWGNSWRLRIVPALGHGFMGINPKSWLL